MTNVLVCIKRVPDFSGEVLLSEDAQSADARFVGFTMSNHDSCAVELAVQVAAAGDGVATVLSVGSADSVEQLRSALGVGCTAAVLVEADPVSLGPADVAHEIAEVVRDHEAGGTTYDLVLLGNDAADSGDFQVGIRLAHELERPVVTGVKTLAVGADSVRLQADGAAGRETYEVPLPAVASVLEGGVEPRYPTITGRMKAKKVEVETRACSREPLGSGRVRLTLPPPMPSSAEVIGEGPEAAACRGRPAAATGGRPVILVYVETSVDGVSEVSLEAITFARDLAAAGGGVPVDALATGSLPTGATDQLAAYGVRTLLHADADDFDRFSGAATAAAVVAGRQAQGAVVVLAGGTNRGNEVMARVATRLGVPMAANVVSFAGLSPFVVTRQVIGGAALEEMRLSQRPAVFTVAGHAVEPVPAPEPVPASVSALPVELSAQDLVVRVVSVEGTDGEDATGGLKTARVVVGAGRGAGGPEGFGDVLELADLLGGTLGVSRVVTSLGWRPHHEQVGQTGSRIAPEVYIPCGISGAIQHWAGCASSKVILAINTDAEAPMMTKATYAVVGDMHEVVPAINEELRRRRG